MASAGDATGAHFPRLIWKPQPAAVTSPTSPRCACCSPQLAARPVVPGIGVWLCAPPRPRTQPTPAYATSLDLDVDRPVASQGNGVPSAPLRAECVQKLPPELGTEWP